MYGPALFNLFMLIITVLGFGLVVLAIVLTRALIVRIARSIHDAEIDAERDSERIWKERRK